MRQPDLLDFVADILGQLPDRRYGDDIEVFGMFADRAERREMLTRQQSRGQ